MRNYLDKLYRGSCWLAAGCIAAICLLVVSQVALNLIDRLSTILTGSAIGLTIPSYADFTGFFLAAASFFALAHTLRSGGHIRVNLLISHLPETVRRLVEIWCVGFAASISLYFTWYTFALTHESFIYNDLSPGMVAVPIWIPQSTMLGGITVLSIALVDEMVTVVRGKVPSYSASGDRLLDEQHDPAASGDDRT